MSHNPSTPLRALQYSIRVQILCFHAVDGNGDYIGNSSQLWRSKSGKQHLTHLANIPSHGSKPLHHRIHHLTSLTSLLHFWHVTAQRSKDGCLNGIERTTSSISPPRPSRRRVRWQSLFPFLFLLLCLLLSIMVQPAVAMPLQDHQL